MSARPGVKSIDELLFKNTFLYESSSAISTTLPIRTILYK